MGEEVQEDLQLARIACNDDIPVYLPSQPQATCSGSRSVMTMDHPHPTPPLIVASYAAQRYQPPSLPFLFHAFPSER
jgi:hypothetical protein